MKYTNNGLVDHVKKALSEKWGYVYGTIGQILTEGILKQKQAQYPKNINPYIDFIRKNWMGRRTADCVNLIKSYLWWYGSGPVYSTTYDVSANGMCNAATEKGPVNEIPEIPGICVWRNGHIGVYIGNGQVIESKGTKYGVVQTPLFGKGANTWTHWLKCPYIHYVDDVEEYQRMIQSHCNFSHPEGVWEVISKHPYARELYKQWALSYSGVSES